MQLSRRQFCQSTLATSAALATGSSFLPAKSLFAGADTPFRLNYIVASAMYGKTPLAELVPEIPKTGAEYIEIWAERHGNQREQIDELGEEAFLELLKENNVKLGSFTCFKFGIFKMRPEMELVHRLVGDMVICNTGKPQDDSNLKAEVRKFAEQLQPHVEFAESLGITIGVENHGGGLINTPDSIRYLMDFVGSKNLGLAMAPYHLPQDPELIANLIQDLDTRLVHFQAWEHGMGCITKLPKEQEMLQLPHRGPLDWKPILAALKAINYAGRTEIFMHPVPRGIPILPEVSQVTEEINAARKYLEAELAQV